MGGQKLLFLLGFLSAVTAFSAPVEPVFRLKKDKPSFAAVALKALSPTDVRFVWQIGVRSTASQTIQVLPELGSAFWTENKMITTARLQALSSGQNYAKKFRLSRGSTTWLPLYSPLVKSGGLVALPALNFIVDGVPFGSLLPSGIEMDDRDRIRNEYVAAAAQARSTAVAWKAYGPRWTKPMGRIVELFADSDFSEVASAENPDIVDRTISDWQSVKERGCEIGNSDGGYAYKYFLDVDHRLSRASSAILKAVVDHFHARASKLGGAPSREEIASLFRISSGYRNPARNKCVGGVPLSRHQLGAAVDLSFAPSAAAAGRVADRLKMDIGVLWREYMEVAARAVMKYPRRSLSRTARSKFSDFFIEFGCEAGTTFLNCYDRAQYVDHVHIGF